MTANTFGIAHSIVRVVVHEICQFFKWKHWSANYEVSYIQAWSYWCYWQFSTKTWISSGYQLYWWYHIPTKQPSDYFSSKMNHTTSCQWCMWKIYKCRSEKASECKWCQSFCKNWISPEDGRNEKQWQSKESLCRDWRQHTARSKTFETFSITRF